MFVAPAGRPATLRAPVVLIAIGVSVVLIYFGASVLIPLILAFFLFTLLDPMVSRLERKGFPRLFGAFVSVLISISVIAGTGFAFYSSILQLAKKIPAYSEKISTIGKSVHGTADRLARASERFLQGQSITQPARSPEGPSEETPEAKPVESPARAMTMFMVRGIGSVLSLIGWLFFIPLISLFLLLEKAELANRLQKIMGDPLRHEMISRELRSMSRGFFLGNFVVFVVMTGVFALSFLAMKLDGAIQLALFAGLLNLVPVFGALVGAILPAAQAFLQFEGFGPVVLVFLISVVVHFVGNNVVMPKFLGNRVNVNASAAMIGFLFWGTMWGPVGLFLAIPLVATLRIVLDSNRRWVKYGDLFATTPTSTAARFGLRGLFKRNSEGRR